MPARKASAEWTGSLKDGSGKVALGSGAWEGKYSFATRFEEEPGTNPEELIGAAHAACFSMALSFGLSSAGHEVKSIKTQANVHLSREGEGFVINLIELDCNGSVGGIDEATFLTFAEKAKENCPVSKALKGVEIKLKARLIH